MRSSLSWSKNLALITFDVNSFGLQEKKLGCIEKGIQVKFFTLNQNVGISLKRILAKFEVSTPFRFWDIAVQN